MVLQAAQKLLRSTRNVRNDDGSSVYAVDAYRAREAAYVYMHGMDTDEREARAAELNREWGRLQELHMRLGDINAAGVGNE